MPTILRVLGFRFLFYSLESGEPPHVHVTHGSKAAKHWLDPVEVANSDGFRAHELSRVRQLVTEHHDAFRRQWDEHHRG
jgi:Domain of unknown function (DUF4160)